MCCGCDSKFEEDVFEDIADATATADALDGYSNGWNAILQLTGKDADGNITAKVIAFNKSGDEIIESMTSEVVLAPGASAGAQPILLGDATLLPFTMSQISFSDGTGAVLDAEKTYTLSMQVTLNNGSTLSLSNSVFHGGVTLGGCFYIQRQCYGKCIKTVKIFKKKKCVAWKSMCRARACSCSPGGTCGAWKDEAWCLVVNCS